LLNERGWPVLVTAVEREADLVAEIARQAPDTRCLVGGTTLPEYAALLAQSALVICGNTLPLHLADALERPVLGLYSGTDYEDQWRPRFTRTQLLRVPTPCHPCYLFACPIGMPCLDITAEEVVAAAESLLGAATTTARDGLTAEVF
jgi:ADP-heptose:LPS heptosyltransferase